MSFLALSTGWAIALLVGVGAMVALLYLLKPTPQRVRVASNLIWSRVLHDRRRAPDRLRWWLSLLLALLIALAMALALTRPHATLDGAARESILVLDNSLSMAARTASGDTRFERAVQHARGLIRAAAPGSRFMIADLQRQIAIPAFTEREAALAALQRLRVSVEPIRDFPALPAPEDAAHSATWFITDGVATVVLPAAVRVLSVFAPADNVAITAFGLRAAPTAASRRQAYIEVFNASPGSQHVELHVSGLGAAPLVKELRVPGGGRSAHVLDVSAFASGPLRAALHSQSDAFAIDDTAWAYLRSNRILRVALITPGNLMLERALRAQPRARLTVIAPPRYRAGSGYDVLVFDRHAPLQPPELPAMLWRPPGVNWLPPARSELRDVDMSLWDRSHPLMQGWSPRDVLIERAASVDLNGAARNVAPNATPSATPVVASAAGQPLLLASRSGTRRIQMGFALHESNFALQAGFPIFLSNALDWLSAEATAQAVALGTVTLDMTEARVLDMEGSEVETRAAPGVTLFEAAAPNLYTALSAGQRQYVAANLLDTQVSAINASRLQNAAPAHAPYRAARLNLDPWALLLLAGALLLMLEWATYHRRLSV